MERLLLLFCSMVTMVALCRGHPSHHPDDQGPVISSVYRTTQIEAGHHGQHAPLDLPDHVVPRVHSNPKAVGADAAAFVFRPTVDTLNRNAMDRDNPTVLLRHTDSTVIRHCPVGERQSCGTEDRFICARWMCCWNRFSSVKCAKPLFTIHEDKVCGSSRLYNPRPRPYHDLIANLWWLQHTGKLGEMLGTMGRLKIVGFLYAKRLRRRRRSLANLREAVRRRLLLQIGAKIINGTEVIPNSFPWVARMYEVGGNPVTCGGVLVGDGWILTAAHCLRTTDPSVYRIVLGDHSVRRESGREQTLTPSRLIPHPSYNTINLNNDIALIKLSKKPETNDYVSPVCIPSQNSPTDETGKVGSFVGTHALATGWGKTGSAPSSDALKSVELQILPDTLCIAMGGKLPGEGKFCAGVFTAFGFGNDTCQGDSGGPLVLYHDNGKMYVHGLTSSGTGKSDICGKKPGVYTKVSSYSDWIINTMKSN